MKTEKPTPKITPENKDGLLRGITVFPPTFSDDFADDKDHPTIFDGTPYRPEKSD